MRGVFVTGTDTNVGKTVVCSALVMALRSKWVGARYWKPIQTGIEYDDDTKTVCALAECSSGEIFDIGFRLERPLSPHLSSRLAGVPVSVNAALDYLQEMPNGRFNIVEGAGGILVPINESELIVDLIRALNIPVLIVSRSSLGTINHTLLTIEAIRNRRLKIAGVVMNGPPNTDNRKAIEHYGQVRVIAAMPEFKINLPRELRSWARTHASDLSKIAQDCYTL